MDDWESESDLSFSVTFFPHTIRIVLSSSKINYTPREALLSYTGVKPEPTA